MEYIVLGVVGLLVLVLFALAIWRCSREGKQVRLHVEALEGSRCKLCHQEESQFYTFRSCRCFGIAPFAAAWEVSRHDAFLCDPCARREAVSACRKTGLYGGWGFPGVIAVALYTIGNIYALLRKRSARTGAVLLCVAKGILVPWLLLALGILLIFAFALLIEMLRHD